jgi:hypothetical protein
MGSISGRVICGTGEVAAPGGMARFLFPLLLIALGVAGLVQRDAINREWAAVYPNDPAQQAALARCVQDSGFLERFSASGRAACYEKYLNVDLPAPTPGISVGIPGAPPAHAAPRAPAIHTNH